METRFKISGKTITLYTTEKPGAPAVYLNTVRDEGGAVWNACQSLHSPAFSLAAISGLDWDHDMSPWTIPPISESDHPCTGGADAYLTLLTEEIMPAAEEALGAKPAFSALAGYSLAGLFTLYAAYRTEAFLRFASASGSFWFPGFTDFAREHPMKVRPEKLYFSLGDRESHTGNPFLAPVEAQTRRLYNWYREKGVNTVYIEESGGHFREPVLRIARGIHWILADKAHPGTNKEEPHEKQI